MIDFFTKIDIWRVFDEKRRINYDVGMKNCVGADLIAAKRINHDGLFTFILWFELVGGETCNCWIFN